MEKYLNFKVAQLCPSQLPSWGALGRRAGRVCCQHPIFNCKNKKTFSEAQTCLAVAITIDHFPLTFTAKSVWIQRYNLFQQSALRTVRVPHSLPVGDRWDTRKCKSPPQFLFQMCLFRIMSNVLFHSSFQKISLWPTPVETEAKPKGQTWQFFQMPARNKQISQSQSHF